FQAEDGIRDGHVTGVQTCALPIFGADGALMVGPYYNKPTQEGYYRHFAAVAEAVDLPIVLYNIPGRTGSNILPETIARLAEIPRSEERRVGKDGRCGREPLLSIQR